MSKPEDPHIVAAERVDGGLVIKFSDGRCSFYSDALLYATLPQSNEQDESKTDW